MVYIKHTPEEFITAYPVFLLMPAVVEKSKCDGCGTCVDECPMGAIELNDYAHVDFEICTECGACVDVCPNEAISLD